MNPKRWPNLLSGARLALAPAILIMAMAASRPWFIALLSASLLSDALDGFLARRLDAHSELGRKLDSVADYLTMITGLSGIALLWPEITRRELPWIAAGLTAFFAVVVYGFIRLGRAPCYHTWAAKAGAVACAFSLIPLLSGHTAMPFHAAIVLQVIAGIEEMAIVLMIPTHEGAMATIWHAMKVRRASSPTPTAPPPT
jgi:phosphatidylglycerophosphate synthase